DKVTGLIDTVNYPGVSNYGIIYAATHGAGIFRDTSYWQQTGSTTFIPANKYVNNTLKVYPNPANTHFTIDYALTSSKDQVQLKVVDITGKIVYTKNLGVKNIGNHSERLDCSNLSSGFYFVNMLIGQHNKTAKIVISK
ncbi:MAG: T9SS type A sorting domain-containing protein, partial [Bacteroidales bacterium]|nr:T9SS type A sorting domain-containing protein [Bacteroidales bacterium]